MSYELGETITGVRFPAKNQQTIWQVIKIYYLCAIHHQNNEKP
jgi:hypothetical protein